MADVKISALPPASTPLAGTEVLPIVQGGTTDKVTVADLTAGRAVAAATLNVDANSASSAVRITQTGAGNALLVEDEANPDATPFVVDASGNVGIGTTTPAVPLNVVVNSASPAVRITQTGAGNALVVEDEANPDATPFVVTATGTVGIGVPSPISQLDVNGTITSRAAGGEGGQLSLANPDNATIGMNVDVSTPDNGRIFSLRNNFTFQLGQLGGTGGAISFNTSALERMRIDSNGNLIAGGSAALATNATNGFLYVPTCAGTPTGVPTAITGMAPIVVNTTNNKLYFYSGGAWRDAGP